MYSSNLIIFVENSYIGSRLLISPRDLTSRAGGAKAIGRKLMTHATAQPQLLRPSPTANLPATIDNGTGTVHVCLVYPGYGFVQGRVAPQGAHGIAKHPNLLALQLTMQQAVFHHYPKAQASYKFMNRNLDMKFTWPCVEAIIGAINRQ